MRILYPLQAQKKNIALYFLLLFNLPAIAHFKRAGLYVRSYEKTDHSSSPVVIPTKLNEAMNRPTGLSIKKRSSEKQTSEKTEQGPGQPETESFQSVSASNMTDLFSGDFSYNIPLMDVGGYPINIHYQSGISMDQEAGWVGLGWNINPGTVSRNMRGIPDDFNGEDVIEKTAYIKPNWTVGAEIGFTPEMLGIKLPGVGLDAGIFYNNYRGIGLQGGFNVLLSAGESSKGSFSGGVGVDFNNNSQSGITLRPSFELLYNGQDRSAKGWTAGGVKMGATLNTRTGLQSLSLSGTGVRRYIKDDRNVHTAEQTKTGADAVGSHSFSSINFAHSAYTPSTPLPFTSRNYNFSIKLGNEGYGFHGLTSVQGYYSQQSIASDQITKSLPAYGYLHFQKANGDENALLDFNREKELAYTQKPGLAHLAIPNYTYDIYTINGEGTGGMFRPYRADIGFMHDKKTATKDASAGGGIDFGAAPQLWHGAADVRTSSTSTVTGVWSAQNELWDQIGFKKDDGDFQSVYFKNPAEKTIADSKFLQAVGNDNTLLPLLSDNNNPFLTPFLQPYKGASVSGNKLQFKAAQTAKLTRDKRSQSISYFTAEDAAVFGLDKNISNHPANNFFTGCETQQCENGNCISIVKEARVNAFRKKQHISEVDVLNADGRRYVYGLPVYNLQQRDVSFSADKNKANAITGLVEYTDGAENVPEQNNNNDGYVNAETIPAYAHSFLLTGLLSGDYTDVTGDGISDDDLGDAVKFSYTKLYGEGNPFKWRTPAGNEKASYNEGLKTDRKDDKGSYMYGEKEVWYLNAVQSKTMIAAFVLNDETKGEIRQDAHGVSDEKGTIDVSRHLRYLKEIRLYNKADYAENGTKAKAIKTVHFEYGYDLCKGVPNSINNQGKLTLKKIWFSYNGNDKGAQSPYIFYYHPTDLKAKNTTPDPKYNPDYNSRNYDRWGNFKNQNDNPAGLNNADYPYTIQDSTIAAQNSAAWTLTDIIQPAGARMHVDYESDDYAYVQNKSAMRMFTLAGFGSNADVNASVPRLYNSPTQDHPYVFVKLPKAAASKNEFAQLYLQNAEKLFFRLAVKMPNDVYGGGYENINTYGRIDDYGISNTDATIAWIKLKSDGNESILAKTAIQFLRLNLPSKAYPGSDLDGSASPAALGKAVLGFAKNFAELLTNFPTRARQRNWANDVKTEQSFVRLYEPEGKKTGGGIRVKRIQLFDNWNAMTGGEEAVYGQEYIYRTEKIIGGQKKLISSGVASFEPAIGNEENPFKLPIEYSQQLAPLAPKNDMYSEYPLGESFFPAPAVGYSKVQVRTVNHKNIKSADGLTETQFYTTYDFPTLTENTPIEERKFKSGLLAQLLSVDIRRYLAQTQGFKVELNDMNGKQKSVAVFAENDLKTPIAFTKYYYKVDNENAEQMHLNNSVRAVNADGTITENAQIGKDIELQTDLREQVSETNGISAEFNIDGFLLGIIPVAIPTLWMYPQHETDRYRSAVVLKVINSYGLLDRVVQYDKGSTVKTENVLYDAETGDVLLTKTQNEFNDPVFQFNYPAHWAYSGMAGAYKNLNAKFEGVEIIAGQLTKYPNRYNTINTLFESGDELKVTARLSVDETDCVELTDCKQPSFDSYYTTFKAWVTDAAKLSNATAGTKYFIDKNGKMISCTDARIEIIRSGHRNLGLNSLGSVVSLVSPIVQVNGQSKIQIDNNTKVISTNAATFKDSWKVENTKLKIEEITETKVSLNKVVKKPVISYAVFHGYDFAKSNNGNTFYPFYDTDFFESAIRKRKPGKTSDGYYIKSFIQFDLSDIPSTSTVIDASLNLQVHNTTQNGPLDLYAGHNSNEVHYTWSWQELNSNESYLSALGNTKFKDFRNRPGDFTNNSSFTADLFNQGGNLFGSPLRGTVKQNNYDVLVSDAVSYMIANPWAPTTFELAQKYDYTSTDDRINRMCFWSKDSYLGNTAPQLTIQYAACPAGELIEKCGVYYCKTKKQVDSCYSAVIDSTVNPYTTGLAGNWRTDKAFAYSDKREQSDPSQPTDIRANGGIQNFNAFWQFDNAKNLIPTTDTVKWVWATQSTRFNRKGFEIENTDALGRNNAVLYGFNETHAVAVAQNSALENTAYESFEDLNFQNKNCKTCFADPHFVFTGADKKLASDESHSGVYSLQLQPGENLIAEFPVKNKTTISPNNVRLVSDTQMINTYSWYTYGYGLNATVYRNYNYAGDNYGGSDYNQTGSSTVNYYQEKPVDYDNKNHQYTQFNPFVPLNDQNYKIVWEGYLVPTFSESFQFSMQADNSVKMWIDDKIILNGFPNDPVYSYYNSNTIKLLKGHIYKVRIEHTNGGAEGYAHLTWKTSQSGWSVPSKDFFYRSYTEAKNALKVTPKNCITPASVKTDANVLHKAFSVIPGAVFLASAWLKQAGDCNCTDYTKAYLQVVFKDANGNALPTTAIRASGSIIDGWQRAEEKFTVPANAVTAEMQLINTGSTAAYFDDVRILPFNANMKSYAYDAVSGRLHAELDENNFATFYEYDDDGTLVRVKKETAQGIKTISETRTSLKKQ